VGRDREEDVAVRRRRVTSGSTLPRLFKCIGGAILTAYGHESEEATIGTAKHAALALRTAMTIDEANDAFAEIARGLGVPADEIGIAEAELRGFRWMPPKGAISEKALALLASGEVVATRGGHGHYEEAPEGTILAGQLDLVWSEPEPIRMIGGEMRVPPGSILYVDDYKTGEPANVDPVENNHQILGYSMLAAKFYKADRVVPIMTFTTKGQGEWDITPQPLGEAAIERVEKRIRLKLEAGGALPLVEGPHCTYCPAAAHCPANTAAIINMLGEVESYGEAPIPPERLPDMLDMKKRFGRAVEQIERVAIAIVSATKAPIDLGDGKAWGPVEATRDEIKPKVALPIIQAQLGEHADHAMGKISKASLERAIGAHHSANGIQRQKAPAMRLLLNMLRNEKAIDTVKIVEHRFHRTDLPSSPKGAGVPNALAAPDYDL
jgi:hypothetical protein